MLHRKSLEDEIKALQARLAQAEAGSLADAAVDGVLVARKDGLSADELKQLAVATREGSGLRAVVLAGSPDGQRVALVGAATKDAGIAVNTLIAEIAKVVGGGGGGKDPTLATAGGRDVSAIDEALALARERLGLPAS